MTPSPHALAARRHWVFDLDGTLTVAVHDFAVIRQALSIRADEDILAHIATLPAHEAAAKRAWLLEHEHALAQASRPAIGAVALVRSLAARGCRLGILTRNLRELALLSLEAIGLADCFDPADVLGREDAPPKPDPAGLHRLAQRWAIEPAQLTMVGDYAYDLACARAAGAQAVLVNLPLTTGPTWLTGISSTAATWPRRSTGCIEPLPPARRHGALPLYNCRGKRMVGEAAAPQERTAAEGATPVIAQAPYHPAYSTLERAVESAAEGARSASFQTLRQKDRGAPRVRLAR